jgi:hypothetical protein
MRSHWTMMLSELILFFVAVMLMTGGIVLVAGG